MKLIYSQFLSKVPADVPRMVLAFLIHFLPQLSSDNGPTPCLFKRVQLRGTIQTTSE